MNGIQDLQYIGEFEDEEYGVLPLYTMDEFHNSTEGWNLYAKLKSTKHPEYIAAKIAFYAGTGAKTRQ